MYLIICDGKQGTVALADRSKTKDCWWTDNLRLAKIYETIELADEAKIKLKFNNPRIATVAWFKEMEEKNVLKTK